MVAFGLNEKDGVNGPEGVNEAVDDCGGSGTKIDEDRYNADCENNDEGEKVIDEVNLFEAETVTIKNNSEEGEKCLDEVNFNEDENVSDPVNFNDCEKYLDEVNFKEGEKVTDPVNFFEGEKNLDEVNFKEGEKVPDPVNFFEGEKNLDEVNFNEDEKVPDPVNFNDCVKDLDEVNFKESEKVPDKEKSFEGEKASDREKASLFLGKSTQFSVPVSEMLYVAKFGFNAQPPLIFTFESIPDGTLSICELENVKECGVFVPDAHWKDPSGHVSFPKRKLSIKLIPRNLNIYLVEQL